MSRRLLLAFAFLLTSFALTVVVTGGFVTTAFARRISARSPLPALILTAIFVAVWVALAYRKGAVATDLLRVEGWLDARWRWIVAGIAVAAAWLGYQFHTISATGADASGYLSYAALLLEGRLARPEPLAAIAKWADGVATLAPLGWRAMGASDMQAPTYAVGLPLLLAPPFALGGIKAASWVVPSTFALAILLTGLLAHRLAGAGSALIAAVGLATAPVALFESIQFMSDVPVTAAWLACWWFVFTQRPLAAGIAAALAILIRPNLAPLALLPALATWRQFSGDRRGLRASLTFAIPVAVAGVVIGYLQWLYFGSPFRSGYGTAAEIYAVTNVAPNAFLYFGWLVDTGGAWLLAAPLALVLRRREIAWTLAFAAFVVIAYLVYARFESWTYLRFLLPAMAVATIAVAAVIARALERLPRVAKPFVLAAIVLALSTLHLAEARDHEVFRFADRQARGRVVGEGLAQSLPVNAVLITGEHSGTMRFYTGRSVLRWDLTRPDAMPDALDWLTLNGYQVWVVLDDWEEGPFRARFPALASASIDYAPSLESPAGVGIRTRAWRVRRGSGPGAGRAPGLVSRDQVSCHGARSRVTGRSRV